MTEFRRTVTTTHKFILLILFISAIFTVDTFILRNRTKGTELHDELYRSLNAFMIDIVRLEYNLDIAVVTKNFAFIDEKGGTIKSDVSRIDKSVSILKDPAYAGLFPAGSQFHGIRNTLFDGWQTVKGELGRLDTAASEEELLLIHSTSDMNTFVLSENVERMLSLLREERNLAFNREKDYIMLTFVLSLLAALGGGLIFFVRVLLPFKTLSSSLSYAASAGVGSRAMENLPGEAGGLARTVNAAIGRLEESYLNVERKEREAREELDSMARKMGSLNVTTLLVSRSLSQFEVTMRAIGEVCATLGADAGALYEIEGDSLKLKVSKGFSTAFFYRGEEVPLSDCQRERMNDGRTSEKPIVFPSMDDYPDGKFKQVLTSEGIKSLVCVPIMQECVVTGFFEVAFKKERDVGDGDLLFLQAMAGNLGVAASHSDVFSKEHAMKIFLERVIQHSPLGVAVFDVNGMCLLANGTFKKYMGCDRRSDFVGIYSIFDDAEFSRQGVVSTIKRSYEGHTVELTTDYAGNLRTEGRRRLKIKSAPLYDAGGNIPSIVMLVDDVTSNNHSEFSRRGNSR